MRAHGNAQPAARGGDAARMTAAGADDLPAHPGLGQRIEHDGARDTGLGHQNQRQGLAQVGHRAGPSEPLQLAPEQRRAAPVALAALADHQVQRTGIHQLIELAGHANGDFQLHIRMRVAKRRQYIGQRAQREVVRGAQPHAALQARRIELGLRARNGIQDQPRVRQQRLAVSGHGQGVGIAYKEPAPHMLFQAPDVVADAGLGQAELAPRVGKAVRGGYGGEGLDPDGIEHAALSSDSPMTVNIPSRVPDWHGRY